MNNEYRVRDDTDLSADENLTSSVRQHGQPEVRAANTLVGTRVYDDAGDALGYIKEVMLDLRHGNIRYVVLYFDAFVGMAEKLFAVPWYALMLETATGRCVLSVDRNRLACAPGFNRARWPDMADQSWARKIHSYYSGNRMAASEPA